MRVRVKGEFGFGEFGFHGTWSTGCTLNKNRESKIGILSVERRRLWIVVNF
jgi:hypothetical protein